MGLNDLLKYTKNIDKTNIDNNIFKDFILNLSNLNIRTKNIKKNFNKFKIYLEKIYTFILTNLAYINIKVDNSHEFYMDIYMNKIIKTLNYDKKLSIVDFGGGQGLFLNYMCEKLDTNKCYVIEKKNDEFVYSNEIISKNKNINYMYWDDKIFDLEDNSIDCCCAIQVLHHIDDKLIDTVIKEFYRILKPNGIIFLVEHDVINEELKINVDSDHHLYYILNDQIRLLKEKKIINIKNCIDNYEKYINIEYINYKNESEWKEIMINNKFNVEVISLNKVQYNGKYYSIYRK